MLPLNLCANISLDFLPGDVLMAATDGLTEASNRQGELFGFERLLHLLEQLAPLSAREIVEGMLQAVLQFSDGQEQSDDQTLILLKGVEV
jgi:sigma-B regulation protein RsbU (phosphoserine phosphatase)